MSPPTASVVAGSAPVTVTATLSNASGTILWALAGPGSIAPSSGTSTSYTPPATVASTTTATLTATAAGLTSSASITVTPGSGGLTVTGRVIDETARNGVGAIPVVIGTRTATTDATGAFSIPGVTPPYDLAIIFPHGLGKFVQVYQGLTGTSLTLVSRISPATGTQLGALVSGALSGGDPPSSGEPVVVAWGSPETLGSPSDDATSSSYQLGPQWFGPSSTTGNLHALQFSSYQHKPVTYVGYGTLANVTLPAGGNVANTDVTLAAVTQSTVTGTVSAPAGLTVRGTAADLDFADRATIPLGYDDTGSGAFSYAVPVGVGTGAITATAAGTTGLTITRQSGIAAGSPSVVIALPPPSTLNTPASGATGVDTSTDFTWTPFPGGVSLVEVTPSVVSVTYFIITAASTVRLPDVSAHGVTLPAQASYAWRVYGTGPFASVDAAASAPTLFQTAGSFSQTQSLDRTFTTR